MAKVTLPAAALPPEDVPLLDDELLLDDDELAPDELLLDELLDDDVLDELLDELLLDELLDDVGLSPPHAASIALSIPSNSILRIIVVAPRLALAAARYIGPITNAQLLLECSNNRF